MDWTSIASIIATLVSLATVAFLTYRINSGKKLDSQEVREKLILDQVVSKEEWRQEIARRDKKIDDLNAKIEQIHADYDAKILIKDALIGKQQEEIRDLRDQISDLQDRLANVESTKAVKQELKDNGH